MEHSITKDFETLLRDDGDEMCDATLITSDGSSIRVHKVVLAARSGYFKSAFFGELSSSDHVELHFDIDILLAIKKYCYSDSMDDHFAKSRYESTPTDVLNSEVEFFLQLVVAADYFMLRGLQQMLWEEAFNVMDFGSNQHAIIPAVYAEAKKSVGVEELKILAWHSYWKYQQKCGKYSWYKSIESDILFEDPVLPRNGNYEGLGMILVLGCDEEDVNGAYYGVHEFDDDVACYTHTVFKKDKDRDEKEWMAIIWTRSEDEVEDPNQEKDTYDIVWFEGGEHEDGGYEYGYETLYRANDWSSKQKHSFSQWTALKGNQEKAGEKKLGPMSFIFKL